MGGGTGDGGKMGDGGEWRVGNCEEFHLRGKGAIN